MSPIVPVVPPPLTAHLTRTHGALAASQWGEEHKRRIIRICRSHGWQPMGFDSAEDTQLNGIARNPANGQQYRLVATTHSPATTARMHRAWASANIGPAVVHQGDGIIGLAEPTEHTPFLIGPVSKKMLNGVVSIFDRSRVVPSSDMETIEARLVAMRLEIKAALPKNGESNEVFLREMDRAFERVLRDCQGLELVSSHGQPIPRRVLRGSGPAMSSSAVLLAPRPLMAPREWDVAWLFYESGHSAEADWLVENGFNTQLFSMLTVMLKMRDKFKRMGALGDLSRPPRRRSAMRLAN